jgi:pSer/pThr/pTyr-binding forkhead associated (FHA) protein/tetratricopeptide (TPR) repeat protein
MPRIVHVENGASREIVLSHEAVTVGRAARHTIPTMDSRASRDHFKVELSGAGWVVTDLGSRNGTMVNGALLAGQKTLSNGDTISIGEAQFRFVDDEPSPAAAPAPAPVPAPAPIVPDFQPPASPPPPPPEPVRLRVAAPGGPEWTLDATPRAGGRDASCAIHVADEKLSGRHFELVVVPEGVLLKDLQSTNGTRVKGEPAAAAVLKDGDTFHAGNTTFVISDPRTRGSAGGGRKLPPALLMAAGAIAIFLGATLLLPFLLRELFPPDTPPPSAGGGNLITVNPSFEAASLDGWKLETTTGDSLQVEIDRTKSKDGGASMRIRGIVSSDSTVTGVRSNAVPAAAGGVYRVEGWVKAISPEGRVGFRLEWLAGERLIGATPSEMFGGEFDWRELRVTGSPPPGADRVRAAAFVAGSVGLIWIDGVRLTKPEETAPGARWGTSWGEVIVDEAGVLRIDAGGQPLLAAGEIRILRGNLAPLRHWHGHRKAEPVSAGAGYRLELELPGGAAILIAAHSEAEELVTWRVTGFPEAALEIGWTVSPEVVRAGLTARIGDLLEPHDGHFCTDNVSEILFGSGPSLVLDEPALATLDERGLSLRWPVASDKTLHLRSAPTWLEREIRGLGADANAASRAGELGKALLLYEELAKRFPERSEGVEAAKAAGELRKKGAEGLRLARNEVSNARKYPSDANTEHALKVIDGMIRDFAGTDIAAEAMAIRKEFKSDEVPPDPVEPVESVEPPKEPIENARKLLAWAEEALGKEEFLKAEIFCRNVMERFASTAEEMKAGELLGRVRSAAKAAQERDSWIRENLTKARNLAKNRQPEKAIPIFEEVLRKYPSSPLVEGVAEELAKLKK